MSAAPADAELADFTLGGEDENFAASSMTITHDEPTGMTVDVQAAGSVMTVVVS